MSDLQTRPARRTSATAEARSASRPLLPSAFLAGLVAASTTLALSAAVALAGWFAADAGRWGDTRDAVRVGADAWLLAHGAGLQLEGATVTVVPLVLTFLCGYVTYRVGRRVVLATRLAGSVADLRALTTAIIVQAAGYAVTALVVAVLAGGPAAESDLGRALLGGFALAIVAGGAGFAVGSGHGPELMMLLPAGVRSVLLGATAVVLLMFGTGSILVGAALAADFGTAATMLSRLDVDAAGGLMFTLVNVAFAPNAALLAGSYLLGPGFAVGAGTVVSPATVVLGPLPAFPLLAALPGDGATPAWAPWLVAVPVLAAAVAAALTARVVPAERLDLAGLRGLGAGLLGAVVLAVLLALAGGSAGPGRMADVGAPFMDTLQAAAVACGGGGLLGGLVGGWWSRRRVSGAGTADG